MAYHLLIGKNEAERHGMNNALEYFEDRKEILAGRIRELSQGSEFYRRLMRRTARVVENPGEFAFESFDAAPRTTKEDLRRGYPKGFLAVAPDRIRGYFESSGTSGDSIGSSRTASFKTQVDLERDYARRLPDWLEGVGEGDVAVIHLPYALTSSGINFHNALARKGIAPVALDQGHSFSSYTRAFDLITSLKAKILVCSNPFLLRDIVQYDKGLDMFEGTSLRYIFMVGIPCSRRTRKSLEKRYGLKVGMTYGMSEFGAVGTPCSEGEVHVHRDFYMEVQNPANTQESLRQESLGGELIVSDLTSEASPIFKYRTGDVGRLFFGPCACGQREPRVEVFGRIADVLKDGGGYLFPTDFQEMLAGLDSLSPVHKIVAKGETEVTVEFHVQQYERNEAELEILRATLRARCTLKTEVIAHRFGDLFEEIYSQSFYRNTQKTKSMAFHDERKGEWIITY